MVKSYSASLNNVAASLNNGAELKSWKVSRQSYGRDRSWQAREAGCLASRVGESHVGYIASRTGGFSWVCRRSHWRHPPLSILRGHIATASDNTPFSPPLPPLAMAG